MDSDLIVIFAFVLALVGMLQWFRLKRGTGTGLGAADRAALERTLDHARRLEERVESLERLLDEDMPGWRRKVAG